MDIRNLLGDDDAVSPVIGVILMVAITVILAAVIGTFVLGLGDQVSNTSPTASFTFDLTEQTVDESAAGTDYSGDGVNDDTVERDELKIVHDGGDKIDGSNLNVSVTGALGDTGASSDNGDATTDMEIGADIFTGDISAGSSTTLTAGDFNPAVSTNDGVAGTVVDLNGATARVVWSSSNGGDTATLGKWTGPDA